MPEQSQLFYILVALGIGLMIGIERGWSQREMAEGQRVAGIRTFTLIGFLGGIGAYMAQLYDVILLALLAGAVLLLVVGTAVKDRRKKSDRGITTELALIMTLGLGILAGYGQATLAAASGVVVTVLLGLKPPLHRWLEILERRELLAAFKFLVMSLVVLPVLPNQGYGPWDALNPYLIWLMVVLISGISFAGYEAVKWMGPGRGLMLTGLVGGLASSTAVAVTMARAAREDPTITRHAATAALASATVLYPRVLIVTWLFAPELAIRLAVPLLAMTAASGIVLGILWPRHIARTAPLATELQPFDIATPLKFGAALAIVIVASAGLIAWLGDAGLVLAAAIAGLTDVDAPTLTAADNVSRGLAATTGVLSVLAAIGVNVVAKGGIVGWIGGMRMGLMVGAGFAVSVLAGAGAFLLYRLQ